MIAEPSWLRERRSRAAEAARTLPLPDAKRKGWEFTDLSGLDLSGFAAASAGAEAIESTSTALAVPSGSIELTQVDATVIGGSDIAGNGRPTSPVVMPLDAAAERFPELIGDRLGTIVTAGDDPFVARNDAEWSGGALIYVPAGTRPDGPISLTAVQAQAGAALNWRTLIVLEENAEAEIWERFVSGPDGGEGLLNGVTEVIVGPSARLRYVCGQALSEDAWVFATQRAEVDRDGSLEWVALGFGSARGKVRMETKLAGRGSSAKVTGAYAGGNRQHLDYDTTQEHAAEDTTSDLAFRGVLADRATAVWRGMIRVDPGAQRTDAFQDCRNLLLSDKAHADSIPGLEIEADDVACTHAAAIAQVDPDQLFYLTSRGISVDRARSLIVEGFLAELVERLPEGPIADALAGALEQRLAELLAE